jgi:hypothetical protein
MLIWMPDNLKSVISCRSKLERERQWAKSRMELDARSHGSILSLNILTGRNRFWRLHRHLFAKDPAQIALFGAPAVASFICRLSNAKNREEWQADFYASCLLMPCKLIFSAWGEIFPDRKNENAATFFFEEIIRCHLDTR